MNSSARHLARRHGELAMLELARARSTLPSIAHVVGRIGEDHLRLLAVHQSVDHIGIERVAADQPVRSQPPDIAEPAAGRDAIRIGEPVVGSGSPGFLRRKALDETIDLGDGEAGDADVELDRRRP